MRAGTGESASIRRLVGGLTLALVMVVSKLLSCCYSRPFSLLSCAARPSIAIVGIIVEFMVIVIMVMYVVVVVLNVVHVMCGTVVIPSPM